ncbi:rRNA-processing protein Utp23p [Diutina catenulata]
MRQKRAKSYRKHMAVYVHTFKFREPYQTIVDSGLVELCHKNRYDLAKGLERTVQAPIKVMITQCSMEELYKTKNQEAIDIAKRFERRRCNHKPAVGGDECIESITAVNGANKFRYVIAAQSEELRRSLRQVPGVPLIFMKQSVMVMEHMSDATKRQNEATEAAKLTSGLNAVDTGDDGPAHKKRKAKGPNPLSVKKAKTSETSEEPSQKKTRRKRGKKKEGEDGENENEGENENGINEKGDENGDDNGDDNGDNENGQEYEQDHKTNTDAPAVPEPEADSE